jgi:hypothetical protein
MPNRNTSTSSRTPRQTHTGRAQPGDMLGIENRGKRTRLGDTAEDENEELEDAEDEIRDDEEDRDA